MTKQQFLDDFYILYDEVSDLSAPGYTPQELSRIASEAQDELVITTYGSKSNKLQEGFEETEKRIQDLGELVRYKTYITFSPAFFVNSVYITLPNTLVTVSPTDFSDVYWFTIYENATVNKLDCTIANNTTKYVDVKVIDTSHGELKVALKDPFRKPYVRSNEGKILRVRSEGRKHILITDGSFNVTRYDVGYVRKPIPIDLTTSLTSQVSELAEHKHRELLEKTIEYCLKITDQQQKLSLKLQIPDE